VSYTDGFKARMVQRMAGPEGITATALSKEVGIAQPTLSRWLREAHTLVSMGGHNEQQGGAKSPRQWRSEDKLQVVVESSRLSADELGSFLRRKGLHAVQLEEWRDLVMTALSAPKSAKPGRVSSEGKRIRSLEKDLARKDKALAEVTALLVLKKKLDAIWGGEGDGTATKNGT
jgi:transposase